MAKPPVVGPCRLCLVVSDLQDSHIVPKWAYRRIANRADQARGQPILMGGGSALRTNFQFRERLLCRGCEGRFAAWEAIVSRLVLQEDESFPWLAALPDPVPGQAADSSAIDAEKIALFACSVLWRASVSRCCEEAGLGPRYEEGFRRYLSGASPFPDNASFMVTLFPPAPRDVSRIDRGFTMPASTRHGGFHIHWFLLCGVRFNFLVGGTVPRNLVEHTFHRSRTVMVDDGSGLREIIEGMVADNKPKGSLAKEPLFR